MWNLEEGDILHTEDYAKFFFNEEDFKLIEQSWKVLSRDNLPNGVRYNIFRQQKITRLGDSLTVDLISDTIEQEFYSDPNFNKLPGTFIGIYDYHAYYEQFPKVFNNRNVKSFDNGRDFTNYYSCLLPTIIDGCWSYMDYIEGLGGPYFNCQAFFTGGLYHYKLIYYKKGDEEWGTPFDFTVATTEVADNHFNIYPNPASDRIHILAVDILSEIRIINTTGAIVAAEKPSGKKSVSIDISHLNAGLYFAQLVENGHVIVTEKFIIQK